MNLSLLLDQASSQPDLVAEALSDWHSRGETVGELLDAWSVLRECQITVSGTPACFDVCGTGGSGRQRINLSTVLALKLSAQFPIAKHGNRAASGKVGSFDLIEALGLPIADRPKKVQQQFSAENLAWVLAPAFQPRLKPLAPIRRQLGHPTAFNLLGPLLNPVLSIRAQLIGVANPTDGEKMAEVCAALEKNVLLVHDTVFGLDDVSLGGKTLFWRVIDGQIEAGHWHPTDWGIDPIKDFSTIQGGENLAENIALFSALKDGTATPEQQNFLELNHRVATDFFEQFSAEK